MSSAVGAGGREDESGRVLAESEGDEHAPTDGTQNSTRHGTPMTDGVSHDGDDDIDDHGLRITPTVATTWAPAGRVVADPARGTVFWEALRAGPAQAVAESSISVAAAGDAAADADEGEHGRVDPGHDAGDSTDAKHPPFRTQLETDSPSSTTTETAQAIGARSLTAPQSETAVQRTMLPSAAVASPATTAASVYDTPGPPRTFRIEWRSTASVPFARTRGLRNTWNAGKEVKIARDGTELETGLGRELIALFGPRLQLSHVGDGYKAGA